MNLEREAVLARLKEHISNEKTIVHCLSSEAVLRALARKLGEDEQRWGLTGLVHDIDMEVCEGDMHTHGLKASGLLQGLGFNEEMLEAISMHNEAASGKPRSSIFQHALAAGETITGLIYATALVYPDRKIASVKYKSIRKRMKEKAFAASVDRDIIRECELIEVPLDDFIQLSVDAMRDVADEIGL